MLVHHFGVHGVDLEDVVGSGTRALAGSRDEHFRAVERFDTDGAVLRG